MQSPLVVRTSDENWFMALAKAYKDNFPFTLVDDARTGVDPVNQSILQMGMAVSLTKQEWLAVALSIGFTGIGMWLVRLAIIDPEPTSKLTILLGGGIVTIVLSGSNAIRLLTKTKPPSIKIGKDGFEIAWND